MLYYLLFLNVVKCGLTVLYHLPVVYISFLYAYKDDEPGIHKSLSRINIFQIIDGLSIIYSSIYDMSGINDLYVFG